MPSLTEAPVVDSPAPAEELGLRHLWWSSARTLLCAEEGASRACRIVVFGFLVGSFLFYADWMRQLWLVFAAVAAFLFIDWRSAWHSVRQDALRLVCLHFFCWMTVRSLLGYGMVDGDSGMVAAGWLVGAGLLSVFGVVVWQAAASAQKLEALGYWTGLGAAFAAGVSFLLFYVVLPGHVFGERLMNGFVYGGWNAVSTGLTFGFAALWLTCLRERAATRRQRTLIAGAILLLLLAVCFTRSRGALFAVLAGFVTLTCVRGLRRVWLPSMLLAAALLVFACSGPAVARVAAWQMQSRSASSSDLRINTQPVAELMQRGDAGRFDLYRRTLRGFTNPERWVLGIGQWGPEEACCRSLGKLHYHLHSAFFATFVHGGLVGIGLLLTALGIGVRRAISLARRGQDTWLVLLAYGCAGLLFDGQTFASLASIPQMETLLFAFPLVAAASAWWHQRVED